MVSKIFLSTLLLAIGLTDSSAFAKCRCEYFHTRENALKEADKVFLGEAISETKQPDGQNYRIVYFAVERAWKGVTGLKAGIKVGVDPACGYAFVLNKTYLVFSSEKSPHYTSGCGFTKWIGDAANDIKALGASTPLK